MKIIELIFGFLLTSLQSQIVFQFSKKSSYDKNINFFLYHRENELYTNINIGTPKISIPLKLTFNYSPCALRGTKLNGIYNETNSKTFYLKDKFVWIFSSEIFNSGSYSVDTIYLKDYSQNDIIYDNFNFILATDINKNKNFPNGIIGLKFQDTPLVRNQSLIFYLKENNLIENNCFTIKFDKKNNNEGYLIIGNYPHEYDTKYIIKYFQNTNIKIFYYESLYWTIEFDSIIWNNISFEKNKNIRFVLDINTIIVTKDYLGVFDEYFKEFNNTCKKNTYKNNTENQIYFTCDSSFNIKEFPSIKFTNKFLNYTFILDSNDLFIKDENTYLFLIIFDLQSRKYWEIGSLFLKKYQLVYDFDKKIIGFYTNIEDEQKIINPTSKFPFLFYLSIIFGFIIIILGIILYKLFILLPRKKRANELSDVYEYISDNSTRSSNIIN